MYCHHTEYCIDGQTITTICVLPFCLFIQRLKFLQNPLLSQPDNPTELPFLLIVQILIQMWAVIRRSGTGL